jgi:hypothetical protein
MIRSSGSVYRQRGQSCWLSENSGASCGLVQHLSAVTVALYAGRHTHTRHYCARGKLEQHACAAAASAYIGICCHISYSSALYWQLQSQHSTLSSMQLVCTHSTSSEHHEQARCASGQFCSSSSACGGLCNSALYQSVSYDSNILCMSKQAAIFIFFSGFTHVPLQHLATLRSTHVQQPSVQYAPSSLFQYVRGMHVSNTAIRQSSLCLLRSLHCFGPQHCLACWPVIKGVL